MLWISHLHAATTIGFPLTLRRDNTHGRSELYRHLQSEVAFGAGGGTRPFFAAIAREMCLILRAIQA